jgi:hypothetical protein
VALDPRLSFSSCFSNTYWYIFLQFFYKCLTLIARLFNSTYSCGTDAASYSTQPFPRLSANVPGLLKFAALSHDVDLGPRIWVKRRKERNQQPRDIWSCQPLFCWSQEDGNRKFLNKYIVLMFYSTIGPNSLPESNLNQFCSGIINQFKKSQARW